MIRNTVFRLWSKYGKFIEQPKYIFSIYILVAVFSAIAKYRGGPSKYNNYLIFKKCFQKYPPSTKSLFRISTFTFRQKSLRNHIQCTYCSVYYFTGLVRNDFMEYCQCRFIHLRCKAIAIFRKNEIFFCMVMLPGAYYSYGKFPI